MPRLSEMTPEQIELLEATAKQIVEVMKDEPIEVEGAPKTAVKYADGGFKVKPLMGGWTLFLSYAYLGKKGEIIFGLTPEDAQEYEFAEFSYKAIDTAFPLAGSQLAQKVGLPGENFKTMFDLMVIKTQKDRDQEAEAAKLAYADNPNFGMF